MTTTRQGGLRPRYRLLFAVLAAPVAWFLHVSISYSVADFACHARILWLLHLITAGALVLAGAGVYAAWRSWRVAESPAGEGAALGRSHRFVALVALLMGPLLVLAILAGELTNVFLEPCR